MNPVLALSRAELNQLLRNKTTAAMALVLPLALGAMFLFATGEPDWTFALSLQLVTAQGLTVYVSTTATFAARRQDLSLKRLRSGELSDLAIIVGVLAPCLLLGLAQCLLLTGIAFAAGAPAPANPAGLVIAITGGVAVNAAVGLLTAAFTASAEAAQITTAPFFFLALGGSIWALSAQSPWVAALPGGAVTTLVRGGEVLPPLASMVLWTVVAALLGLRYAKWDRRN
ncbi:hypothetical protein [Actinokineospora diospyrosa]|uniref:ABC-2 type transport system permease protein n=1 Tax=Actinokineospora diospyrosa TaxID=103728 RepID=A0ABT1I792_9PSEU|nr:hypothetical protein [Actinokineospora diospyrosa]MCP2268446.1 ABC-2 type transport system permease protein [Actinokineospora diospyrosa]